MSKLHVALALTRCVVAGGLLAGSPLAAGALVLDVSLTGSHFVAGTGELPTVELPPQEEVVASFTLSTDGVRDVPDAVTVGQNGDEPPYEVLNVYTTPVAAAIEIAGYAYPLEDLTAYLGFVNGTLAQILVSGRAQYEPGDGSGPAAHLATATTNDFILNVNFESAAGYEGDPFFAYTTSGTLSVFDAQALRVSVSQDGGPPREWVVDPPIVVEDPVACETAQPAGGDGSLEGDARPGDLLCEPPPLESAARSAGGATRLRDVRVGRSAAEGSAPAETLGVTTQLGTVTLRAKSPDRVLLAAAAGSSADLEAPPGGASYRCAKVRRAPGAARLAPIPEVSVFTGDGRGYDRYAVRKPTRLCVDAGSGASLLCYAVKAKDGARSARRSELWVAHELGVERLRLSRGSQLCLPASTAVE